tara:strand:+ start:3896 stop:4096 length:201 start_codon:yes stop_codon:yes gene_type:complete
LLDAALFYYSKHLWKMKNKINLNKHRQVKDSYYKNENIISNSITYLCAIYPNNAELGAAIRKHFQK